MQSRRAKAQKKTPQTSLAKVVLKNPKRFKEIQVLPLQAMLQQQQLQDKRMGRQNLKLHLH